MSDKLTTLAQLRVASKKSADLAAAVAGAAAEAIEETNGLKADKATFVGFTIPITGWKTDSAVAGYPNYIDISVSGLTADDCVAVNVAPSSSAVAKAAGFAPTESLAGVLRLRASSVPGAAITAQYHIIEAATAAEEA